MSSAPQGMEAVIGLEIHVQLSTRTKMFCGCELSFGDEPNVHTCPVCLGHPGALPVLNEQAVRYGLEIALALGCEVAERSDFHRKNYFYPDLPKGYQITQYTVPLGAHGNLDGVRIQRVHLEEDAAKLLHASASGRIHDSGASIVDFNRGGTPLLEIVTEPDLRDASVAREWLALLRETIRQIGASDVNMEEGSLRCDANVSLRPTGQDELGTKTELKNMNSFRFLERGIDAEVERQAGVLGDGGRVTQQTLHFDPRSGSLTPLRSKEEAHDYRYFPEPDLVGLVPTEEMVARARDSLGELPSPRRRRYLELELPFDVATQLAFDPPLADLFDAAGEVGDVEPRPLAHWVTAELAPRLRDDGSQARRLPADTALEPAALAELVGMVESRSITRDAAREVLGRLVESGGEPAAIVAAEGLGAMADEGALEEVVRRAIEADPEAAARVREGNEKAVGPLVGFVMRETRGRADGGEVTRLIRELLSE